MDSLSKFLIDTYQPSPKTASVIRIVEPTFLEKRAFNSAMDELGSEMTFLQQFDGTPLAPQAVALLEQELAMEQQQLQKNTAREAQRTVERQTETYEQDQNQKEGLRLQKMQLLLQLYKMKTMTPPQQPGDAQIGTPDPAVQQAQAEQAQAAPQEAAPEQKMAAAKLAVTQEWVEQHTMNGLRQRYGIPEGLLEKKLQTTDAAGGDLNRKLDRVQQDIVGPHGAGMIQTPAGVRQTNPWEEKGRMRKSVAAVRELGEGANLPGQQFRGRGVVRIGTVPTHAMEQPGAVARPVDVAQLIDPMQRAIPGPFKGPVHLPGGPMEAARIAQGLGAGPAKVPGLFSRAGSALGKFFKGGSREDAIAKHAAFMKQAVSVHGGDLARHYLEQLKKKELLGAAGGLPSSIAHQLSQAAPMTGGAVLPAITSIGSTEGLLGLR